MKNVSLDTNIIVRYLFQESTLLKELINTCEVYISTEILIETIFLLEKFYEKDRTSIYEFITSLLGYDNVTTDKDVIRELLTIYVSKNYLSVIDCFLIVHSKKNRLEVITFDKGIQKYLKQSEKESAYKY